MMASNAEPHSFICLLQFMDLSGPRETIQCPAGVPAPSMDAQPEHRNNLSVRQPHSCAVT